MITLAVAFIFLIGLVEDKPVMLKWEDQRNIQWSDFKAKPNVNSPYDAQVYSGMQYSLSYRFEGPKSELSFDVYSFFNPEMSWSKVEKRSDYLLKHEQLHFDISELYARKLRQALTEYKPSKDPRKDVEKMFDKFNNERKQLQSKYDRETDHSKNKAEQEKWDTFIISELNNYKAFQ